MEACGGAAKGLRFDRKGVRTTPPGLGPMGEEICGKTIELWNPSLHVWLRKTSLRCSRGAHQLGLNE